jgi:hypothetical protein
MPDQIIITTLLEDTVTVNDQTTAVLELSSVEDVVTVTEVAGDTITVQEVGTQGPKGDQGDSGQTYQATAGETLSGNRVVYIEGGKAYYFDPSNTALYGRTLGITTGAALVDETVNVQMGGVMDWTGTALTPGALYYAGPSGQLTTNADGLTVLQSVGHAIASNKLKITFDSYFITI